MRPDIVVITGASAGIGRATACEFARRGAWLGLIARGEEKLQATVREVEGLGGRAIAVAADVADPDAVERAARLITDTFGGLDIWINNAMVSVFAPIKRLNPEEIRRVTEVTYLGAVHGTLSALRRMQPADHGVIIQVSSTLAFRAIPIQSAYCAAKHALKGFTESLWCELRHDHSAVRVTLVHLPAVNTPQFTWVRTHLARQARPMAPLYQPEVAARAIYWAAYHARREVYVSPSPRFVRILNALLPKAVDVYLARQGYAGQQRETPKDPHAPDNLFAPVERDYGAHGAFDDEAKNKTAQFYLLKHGRKFLGVLATAAALWLGYRGWRNGRISFMAG